MTTVCKLQLRRLPGFGNSFMIYFLSRNITVSHPEWNYIILFKIAEFQIPSLKF